MIVVRLTQRARYGKGDQVVQVLKEMLGLLATDKRVSGARILTDISGPSFTVESEFQVQNLATFEQLQAELFQGNAFAQWFARLQPLIQSGHRDFFHAVSERRSIH